MTRPAVFTFVAALSVFCIVQDRVTAGGVREYVDRARLAMTAGATVPPVETVMRPTIRRSVRQGVVWAGITAAAGVAISVWHARRRRA